MATPQQLQWLDQIKSGEAGLRASLVDPTPPPPPSPTYALSVTPQSGKEGDTFVFTLKTTNVAPGTSIGYVISGVSAAD